MLGERKGQPCRILWQKGSSTYIEFEDGLKALVPRYVLRRKRGM
jgi:hypothetical protein